MEKLQTELAGKVKALKFRINKTKEVMAKGDRQATERQCESITNIAGAINTLKETLEEKKFSKGESDEQVAEWSKEYEQELATADENVRILAQRINQMDLREKDEKAAHDHGKNLQFELALLEQKAQFEKTKATEDSEQQQTSAAKLPKLPITKFNGKIEEWLPFWGKFKSEIDSTNLPTLTKFSYLKELLEKSVRDDVNGLPFTDEGYTNAKAILEAEYGQSAEVVNAYVQNIMKLPVVTETNPKKIQDFYKQLRYNVESLKTLGKLADVKGNVRATLDKLKGIKADLVRGNQGWQEWSFDDLLGELKKWRDINPVEEKQDSEGQSKETRSTKRSKFYGARDSRRETRGPSCVYCEDTTHKSSDCKKLVGKEERKKFLATQRLCFNCTGPRHRASECKSKMGCRKCHQRHHTSICDQAEQLLVATGTRNSNVTYPVVLVQVEGIKCRALLDTGAGSSYASAALLDRISNRRCKKEVRKIEMMLGATTREVELSTIEIKGTSGDFSMSVEVTKVNKSELLYIDNPRYQQLINENPHLTGVKMEDLDTKDRLPVHVILGASEYAKLKTDSAPKIGQVGQPVAELTQFGWTILSPGKESVDLSNMLLTQTSQADYEQLCSLDVLGLEDTPADDQGSVYNEFKEQLTRDQAGWYETGLPWRGNHPELPNNEARSLRRLASLAKRLKRQKLTTKYTEIIEEQKAEGIIESADKQSVGKEFYIPHKPVVRSNAESTKLRIVYDASARAYDGAPSLNECLHPGPPLQNKLWNVLVRGRFYPVAVTGDLQKAFLQVRIRSGERDALRFHWRPDEHSPLETLRFTRALFGLAPSPFLLGGVIEAHLGSWEKQEPEVVEKIRRELYVDDLISGSTSVCKAQKLKEQATAIFQDAGFTLHKWHSNEAELQSAQTKVDEPTYAKQQLAIPEGEDCGLLGLGWNKRRDTVSVAIPSEKAVVTKRGILAKVAKIYDPLGLVSPITLSGKMIYRAACDTKKAWDAPLPYALDQVWNKWESELPQRVEIPRSLVIHREQIQCIELHSFGDASGNGVATCVYAVVQQDSGSSQGLIASRSRLSKRGLTIPRLELIAGHMAVNLVRNVKEALTGFPVTKVHCWLDSSVALFWIKGAGEFKQFVANRVQKINSHQDVIWRHVPSADNPADLASRGGLVDETKRLWWDGPTWLRDPTSWPPDIVTKASSESNVEMKACRQLFTLAVQDRNELDDLLRKGTLWRTLRIGAWIARFLHNSRAAKDQRRTGPLTTDEINQQKLLWEKRVQHQCKESEKFEEDRMKLNLQKNSNGVLVCIGRIQGHYPIYLPDTCTYTEKFVQQAHNATLHGGVGLTMAKVRQEHWVPRLRRLTKRVIRACAGCKRFRAISIASPPPGLLPKDRTEGITPFQVIGVDYAGPLAYKVSKKKEGKAYILLYSCSLIRALHLELLPSLETQDFISSLKKFIARRGRPKKVYSDNGRTFVGAARWLKLVMRDEKINDFLAQNGIEWQFNLSRAPWWGGQFERLVGLVKRALHKSIGRGLLTWKELEEVLLDVEVALNGRPLSYAEEDLEMPMLTPNAMLYPQTNLLPELEPHHVEPTDLRKRARYLRRCKVAMWSRWTAEYVRGLRESHNLKCGKKPAIAEGDVVIIQGDDKNRNQWKLGIVKGLIVGRDGTVRAAKLRAGKGTLERAVQHLYPLELSCDKTVTNIQPQLNPDASTFRPERNAAVAARLRIQEIASDE